MATSSSVAPSGGPRRDYAAANANNGDGFPGPAPVDDERDVVAPK